MRANAPSDEYTTPSDVEDIQSIAQVPRLLQVCIATTGMKFAAIARVTDTRWVACATQDETGIGPSTGDALDLRETICEDVDRSGKTIVIDDIRDHPDKASKAVVGTHGFRSFISVPITMSDGSLFGTLCLMDPQARALSDGPFADMLGLFTDLIASEIGANRRARANESEMSQVVESSRLREEFIGVIGHDLRNPVSALSAGLRMLPRADAARQEQIIAEMQKSVLRMSALIQNLMDFTRGRLGGRIQLERTPEVDLAEMLTDLAHEIEIGMSRRIETSIDIPQKVHCDPGRIGQLVSNLLANATTHGASDSPVRLMAHTVDGMLRIEVGNSGEPIPEHRIQRLFEPYSRGGETTRSQGLGLGLHIASRIAEAHDGSLTARSSPAETVFTFEMPLARV
ncbi:sensor histidine kinase [Palleronia abyssalis]|uniref:histidine kinase n=1 Tax=Palleronia abyssalis TaxID=1501240 RepID=A0A2R8BQL1_9RHOB|nr:GAF domain-containing sensor histidine kinase [Palleronia abyssalis]SPJ22447.1 Bacteriophytochrome [Palleronia abyssalis]